MLKLSLIFLFVGSIYASDEKKDIPIDDANKIVVKAIPVDDAVKTVVKEDSIKGGDKLEDSYNDEKILLSTIDKVYQLKRDNLYFPPYRCFIYHTNEKITKIGTINNSKIDFKIQKSLLSVGDIIVVTNNLVVKGNPFGQVVVEEIEILE